MTFTDLWAVIGGGGVGAAFMFWVLLYTREDVVAGRTYRREIDRNERLSDLVEKTIVLSERMTDVMRDSVALGERMTAIIESLEDRDP